MVGWSYSTKIHVASVIYDDLSHPYLSRRTTCFSSKGCKLRLFRGLEGNASRCDMCRISFHWDVNNEMRMIPIAPCERIWTMSISSGCSHPPGLTNNVLAKALNASWNLLGSKQFTLPMCWWQMGRCEELALIIQSKASFLVEGCHERVNIVRKHVWCYQVLSGYPFTRTFIVCILGLSILRQ